MISPASISATAKALLSYYPLPNVSGQSNFFEFSGYAGAHRRADIRLDQTITSKQSAYARFSRETLHCGLRQHLLPNDSDSVHNRSLSPTPTPSPRAS